MSDFSQSSSKEIWKGRPWILPYVIIRTVLVVLFTIGALFTEDSMGVLQKTQFGFTFQVLTIILFFLIWFFSVFNLVLLWFTNHYVLRVDSLEIKIGVLTTKTSVIVPTGFSDLEVIRSIGSRILNTGEIKIKTQSERDFTKRMIKVRDPIRIANLIRDVMTRQIHNLDGRTEK